MVEIKSLIIIERLNKYYFLKLDIWRICFDFYLLQATHIQLVNLNDGKIGIAKRFPCMGFEDLLLD